MSPTVLIALVAATAGLVSARLAARPGQGSQSQESAR